jgi:hypothetical protein
MVVAEAHRTLVKSPPELWSELSDPAALARHLGELGEIRIVRTRPEESVEWEAHDTRGTVELTPSGWGTKVTLSVRIENRAGESTQATPPAQAPADRPPARVPVASPEAPGRAGSGPPAQGQRAAPAPAAAPQTPERSAPLHGPQPHAEVPGAPEPDRPDDSRVPAGGPLAAFFARLRAGGWAAAWRRSRSHGQAAREDEISALAQTPPVRQEDPDEASASEPAADADAATGPLATHAHAAPAPIECAAEPVPATPTHPAPAESVAPRSAVAEASGEDPARRAAQTAALLCGVLDRLGEAHHRPFSRS